MAFNANCLPNVTDFSRFQAVTYTVRVVVSQKCCKMLLPHYTRKCHVGYRFVRFLMTLKVFTGCRPFQMQFDEHLCNVSRGFNWQRAARSIGDSWVSCFNCCRISSCEGTEGRCSAGVETRRMFSHSINQSINRVIDMCQPESRSFCHYRKILWRYTDLYSRCCAMMYWLTGCSWRKLAGDAA